MNVSRQTKKFELQDKLYEFPYHYLPILERGKVPRLYRQLPWGLDYLTYMSFVVDQIIQIAPQALIDIGCGDGRLVHWLKNIVPNITGVDLSERAIAFARAFNPEATFYCADIATISGTFECATLVEVLEHIPDELMPQFICNVARLVQEDGYLLISVPTVNVSLNKKHYRHYDFDLLNATLEPHFTIQQHWWVYRRSFLERCLRLLMVNPIFILNFSPMLTLIWRIHRHKTYFADASTGMHLVCVARRENH